MAMVADANDPLGLHMQYDHLLQHLWDRYKAYVADKHAEGQIAGHLEDAIRDVSATEFLEWGTDYLNENRVADVFYTDANHGVRLTNLAQVLICPSLDTGVPGALLGDDAVPVTEGRNRPGEANMDEKRPIFQI